MKTDRHQRTPDLQATDLNRRRLNMIGKLMESPALFVGSSSDENGPVRNSGEGGSRATKGPHARAAPMIDLYPDI
jgi:hypothetical protein